MSSRIVELQEICEFLDNQRIPVTDSDRKPGPYPYYGANGQQDWIDSYIFDEPLVLLAEDGGHFGSKTKPIAYKVTGKCWVNNHAHVLRPKANCDIDYLHHILSFYDVTRFINGTTREKLTKSQAERIPIPLPTLAEQKRIAAILENADRLRRQRHYALELSNTYLQSVFLEMFGGPATNPMGWKIVKFADLVEAFEGGVNFNPVSEDGPTSTWRVLKISSVTSGEFKPYESKAITPNTVFDESLVVRKGDLIISRANTSELVGAVCMVRQTPPNILLPDKLWRIKLRMPAEVNANYLLHTLQLPYTRKIIGELATGTSGSMKNISKDKAGTIPIMLPIKELQEKFSEVVQKKEQLSAQQREAERQAEHLFQTLLHQAFQGNVGLGSGVVQDEAVEDGVQPSVDDSQLTGSYVQLRMNY